MLGDLVTVLLLAAVICGTLVYTYALQTYARVPASGRVAVFADPAVSPSDQGHLIVTGKFGTLPCALLIDTGFSGPPVLNASVATETCAESLNEGGSIPPTEAQRTATLATCVSDSVPTIDDPVLQRWLFGRGVKMGTVRTSSYIGIDGENEMAEAMAEARVSLDDEREGQPPVGGPRGGRSETVQVMGIAHAPCILTLDYLVKRRRSVLDLRQKKQLLVAEGNMQREGHLLFGDEAESVLSSETVVFPEQCVSGGVVLWKVCFGNSANDTTDHWLIVDTGFCHTIAVGAATGTQIQEAGGCCVPSTFVEQFDVFGESVCHRALESSAWLVYPDAGKGTRTHLSLCNRQAATVIVRDSDSGPTGLIGLGALRGLALVFDADWGGARPRIGIVVPSSHTESCPTVPDHGPNGTCSSNRTLQEEVRGCTRCTGNE